MKLQAALKLENKSASAVSLTEMVNNSDPSVKLKIIINPMQ